MVDSIHEVTKIPLADSPPLKGLVDTDVANARRLEAGHATELAYTDAVGWMSFDGKRWVKSEHEAMRRAKETVIGIYKEIQPEMSSEHRDLLLAHIKRSQNHRSLVALLQVARDQMLCDFSRFDADPVLFNVSNGTLNLGTGLLQPHAPSNYCAKIAPVIFDPDATCPGWLAFVDAVMAGNVALVEFLQRAVGYLLSGLTTEQVVFFFHGPGANGKSVFREVVRAVMGEYATVTPEATIRGGSGGSIPNDIARLPGARMVAVSEISDGMKLNEGRIKDLSGGDTVAARYLHREYFEFVPQLKLVLTGNHKPEITGTDDGIWRRMLLVPFVVQIPVKDRDPRLLEKLKDESAGILNWALAGYRRWSEIGLAPPSEVRAAVQEYRADMDVLAQFLDECCEVGNPQYEVKSTPLLERFNEWSRRCGEPPLSSVKFSQRLIQYGFDKRRTNNGVRWSGIQLNSPSV